MGGSGSGNFYRFDSKTLTDHCISIDVRHLNRKGRLTPGQRYSWKWTDGNNIMIETKSCAIELDYKTHMSLKTSAEAHARKMKAISVDISFMGNPHEALPHTRRMKNLMNLQILLLSMGSEG